MGKLAWKPSNLLAPLPAVLVSCADEQGRANLMTAAWAGTISSDPVMVSVSIRPERYSHDIIERTGEFVLNVTTEKLAFAADFCGVRSGRDMDKFARLGLTPSPSGKVRAPGVAESPMSLECRVTDILRLGAHDMFLGEVLQVDVDEGLMDDKGRLALEKAGLIAYIHGEYYALGERLGTFGWSVKKKKQED